jgi:hypothetical protein
MVSHIDIGFWFLIVYGILPYLKDTYMPVYKRYMIQYSTIVPYYVKVDHNLTFVSSMTLPKHVASQRRTKNKGISILLLVETNLVFSKSIQNHDADFLHRLLRKKDRKLAHTCNSSFCNKVDVLSLSNSRIGDELHRIYPH